jgi:hypothetical protein
MGHGHEKRKARRRIREEKKKFISIQLFFGNDLETTRQDEMSGWWFFLYFRQIQAELGCVWLSKRWK